MNWTIAQLQKIDQNDDLHIAPVRKNGDIGTPTWIWEVIVDNRLFVRAYNGVHSSWYQSELENNGGIIEAAGERHNVVFVHIDAEDLLRKIDVAYQNKYNPSPYVAPIISNRSRSTTIEIILKE